MFTAFERAQKRLKVKHSSLKPRQLPSAPPRKTLPKSKTSSVDETETTFPNLEEKKKEDESCLDNPIPWPPTYRNGTPQKPDATTQLSMPGAKLTLSTAASASIMQLTALKSLSCQENVDTRSWVAALITAGAMAEDLLDAIDAAMDAVESTAEAPTDSELQVATC